SGNVVQVPIHIPINLCGNTVNVVGALNPAFGNTCINASGGHKNHHYKGEHHKADHDGEY
ncbi:chaplin, partial [Streptomyces sp. H27-H5]